MDLRRTGADALAGGASATIATHRSTDDMAFSGLGLHLGNLSRLSNAKSRSISPENFTGEKGKGGMSTDGPSAAAARDLGQGWKISPYIIIQPGETFTLADIEGAGAIQQIWMTLAAG